jgi:threonine dehydrogenase-like Zn-dependent dehydrogenase
MKRQAPAAGEATARALWYAGPGRADLRPARVPAPGPDEARVRTLWTALSRGTERLVLEGLVPPSEHDRMRAPHQEGSFPYPVKYGYCAVGVVEAGPAALVGRPVFALHPHQSAFTLPVSSLLPLPEGLPPRRAVLAANMETALNGAWDAGVGPGDRVVVVGGGVVGLLVAAIAAGIPGARVTVVDRDPARAAVARLLGAAFARPEEAPGEADVVIHASGSAAGLALALASAGEEAAVVEMSWYGAREVAAPLGAAFHSRRLRLVSSQVGRVPPARRPRWTHRRRAEAALALLADPRLDALLTEEVPFADLPAELPRLLAPDAPGLCALVRYDGAGA